MRQLLALGLGLLLLAGGGTVRAQQADPKIFPYPYQVRDLPNGLRVVVVPTGFPDIVSLQIAVSVGSRNEVEPGKSGFAHFFEHMMFRGTERYPAARYGEILQNAGADQNAYTSDDITNYHTTFSKADLETVLMLEADRFQNLRYSVEDFKTESRAILGEYNKNAANPVRKLFERQRDLAFTTHTYRHTTMGFLRDIEDMPNQFDYSLTFFDRFYRPENTSIIVAGDVDPAQVFALAERYWGGWKRGSYRAEIPQEPAPQGPLYEHVAWETPTLPWVTVAFRSPAFSDTDRAYAAVDLAGNLAFGRTSPLYEKLVLREQKVQDLFVSFPARKDPQLFTVLAQVNDPADLAYVRDEIQKAFAGLRTEPVSARRLDDIERNARYSFTNSLDNSESIADVLPSFMVLTRDPESVNRLFERYAEVTPADVQAVAARYFTDAGMVVVTLAHQTPPLAAGSVDALARPTAAVAAVPVVRVDNSGPLVNVRFLFGAGAAHDPKGKEGLAELTARMVAQGGSREMTYEQIQQALFPMAAGFGAQVDKEMTVFGGLTHTDNLDAFYEIVAGQLLRPAWRETDFQRIRTQLINDIRVALRGNNDEELGKEVLFEEIYRGHPYGHLTLGHVGAIEALTLADVQAFYAQHYTRANLTLGLAGNLPEAFVARLQRDLAALPEGKAERLALPEPKAEGTRVTLVDKDTRGTAISFGFPISVNRASKDFAALWVATSFLGEHRNSTAWLYQRLRELRGMNYGDYAYIEYFPRGMFQFHPDPNLARQQQIFQVWIRPVVPENGHFALRLALWEFDRLVREGLTRQQFESTRNYLLKFIPVLTKTQDRRLGYALDSRFYGMGDFNTQLTAALRALTIDDVNRAVRRHFRRDNLQVVVVTDDAAAFRERLLADAPSPIRYDAPKPKAILREDRIVERFRLGLRPEQVTILPVDRVFEGPLPAPAATH